MDEFPSIAMPEETGDTFSENSIIKARAVFSATRSAAPNSAVLADDSGLEVAALGGKPGVRSARYAGENSTDGENVDKLLSALGAEKDRRARFVCHLTVILPSGGAVAGRGVCEGEIAEEKRGAGGFGYDPVFFLPSLNKTMAELEPEEKNRLSHRAAAAKEIAARLRDM